MSKAEKCSLISVARFGWSAYMTPTTKDMTSTISGYGDDWQKYATASPGCPVIDTRPAYESSKTFVRDVMACPVVDVRLKDGVIDRTDLTKGMGGIIAATMAPALAAGQLAHKGPGPGPLDSVSPNDYVAWWRGKGVKIGRVDENGVVQWEE